MNPRKFDALLKIALAEDAARNDITSLAVIPQKSRIKAAIIAKEPGIFAGIDLAARVFKLQDKNLSVRTLKKDGSAIKPGQAVLTVEGSTRSIFAAERTALNFLMHLSGIATLTRAYVDRVRDTGTVILDTRKTIPGLRALQQYAVGAGGGTNHRGDLADAVLIKTNHLRVLKREKFGVRPPRAGSGRGSSEFGAVIQSAVAKAKRLRPRKLVEVEVADLREFKAALPARPDVILLDNWSLKNIQKAVRFRNSELPTPHSPLLEASGGVTLANVRAIARTGVDRISIGRLTHSAPALDCSLKVD